MELAALLAESYPVSILLRSVSQVLGTLARNWPFLLAGTLVAAFLRVHLQAGAVSAWFRRRTVVAVVAATLLGATTPL